MSAGAPRLGRTSSVLAPGMARRSADVPLQQLLDAQRVPTAPRARRASVGGLVPSAPGAEGEMVPYNPRARRMSTVIASQRVLPTEASTALPFMPQTIPEDGMHLTVFLPGVACMPPCVCVCCGGKGAGREAYACVCLSHTLLSSHASSDCLHEARVIACKSPFPHPDSAPYCA